MPSGQTILKIVSIGILAGVVPQTVPDFVKTLCQKVGLNFAFVDIECFDHLFAKVIWPHLDEQKTGHCLLLAHLIQSSKTPFSRDSSPLSPYP